MGAGRVLAERGPAPLSRAFVLHEEQAPVHQNLPLVRVFVRLCECVSEVIRPQNYIVSDRANRLFRLPHLTGVYKIR